jgi:hypothetical protein
VSPPNQTDLPPEETAHEAQRVALRSKRPRAEVCWQGRQEMRAVISVVDGGLAGAEEAGGEETVEMCFSPVLGVRVRSMSCHQSSSTAFWMPLSLNH